MHQRYYFFDVVNCVNPGEFFLCRAYFYPNNNPNTSSTFATG